MQVLSDEEKRKVYDRHGEEGLKQGDFGGDPFSRWVLHATQFMTRFAHI
jgi:DnaJ-class molecular chaperone